MYILYLKIRVLVTFLRPDAYELLYTGKYVAGLFEFIFTLCVSLTRTLFDINFFFFAKSKTILNICLKCSSAPFPEALPAHCELP